MGIVGSDVADTADALGGTDPTTPGADPTG
jgi:hypothetical protein